MGGVYGIVEAKKIAVGLAEVLNVVMKLVKGNFLALFSLLGALTVFKDLKLEDFKKEILELDVAERAELEAAFIAALNFEDKVLQDKFSQTADCLNMVVDVVGQALHVVDNAKLVINKFKTILGV